VTGTGIGAAVPRREDARLLTGRARYGGDIPLSGMVAAAFLRSPHPHARIGAIRADATGHVFTASHLDGVGPIAPRWDGQGFFPTAQRPLAVDKVRYVGEPVAVVVARSRYEAEDLLERIHVTYEPLPPVSDAQQALRPQAPQIHEDNVLYRWSAVHGDPDAAAREADVLLRIAIGSARCTASPLEGRAVTAWHDGRTLCVWTGTQMPFLIRSALAHCLGLPENTVQVIVPDTGGGFGQKMHLYPEEIVVAWLALRLGIPVQWIEDRRENLVASTQAREEQVELECAARRDGTVLGLRAHITADVGAYHVFPTTAALEPLGAAQILPGPYAVRNYAYDILAVATNKAPTGAYRGVGMTVGVLAMERAMDMLAERCGLDPVEIRRRNLIPDDALPYRSASGLVYDGGAFREALDRVCALADYPRLRDVHQVAQAGETRVGIGVACYVEYTGLGSATFRRRGMIEIPGHEAAAIKVDPGATVRVYLSFPSQGQGHETTMAQLVAEVLHISLDRIVVERVDTMSGPHGSGTFASRTSVAGAGAVLKAAAHIHERATAIAGALLEASPKDIEWADGRLFVRGAPLRAVTFEDIAQAAHRIPQGSGITPGLEAVAYFDPPPATFSGGAHLAVVEVDPRTGLTRVAGYFVAEDCGRILNPLIVRGQLLGGIAQGIGEALLEHCAYDDQAQPLATTFMDYLLPLAADIPPEVRAIHLEHPSDRPGGFRGMGEGGAIAAPAAIANAVANAIGVQVTRLPVRPEDILSLLARGA
jgi:aerobic carbon-monoxide dehydrogenase large subunit